MAFSFSTTLGSPALAVITTRFDLSGYTLTVQVSSTSDFASVQNVGTATWASGRITLQLTSDQVNAVGSAYYRIQASKTNPAVSFFVTSGRIVNTQVAKPAPSTGDVTAEGYLSDGPSSVTALAGSSSTSNLNIMVIGTNDVVPNGTRAGTLIVRTTGAPPPLSLPTAITLSASASSGQVTLTATGGIGSGVSYAIYRGTSVVSGTLIGTSFPFTDSGRTNGTAYSYVVTATNVSGTVTSNVVTVTPTAPVDNSVRPVFITSSYTMARTQSASSLVLNKPSGVANGDLLVAFLHSQNGGPSNVTLPTGWIMLANYSDSLSQRSSYIAGLAVPNAAALTDTSWTFPFIHGTGRCVGSMARVTGADLSSPVGGIGTTPTVVGNAIQSPSFTTNKNGCLTLGMIDYQAVSPNQPIPSTTTEGTIVYEFPSIDDTSVTRSTQGVLVTNPSLMNQASITVTPASTVASRSLTLVAIRPA
jgi:hypothetical protein